jgi:hypothetical protein
MAISNSDRGLTPGICTSTTRPTAPYEGQLIYTTDLDTLEIWNGTAWRIVGASTSTNGTVLQVVTGSTSTAVSNSTTTAVDTGLSATITPKSITSKVLVFVNQNGADKGSGNTANAINLDLYRGATLINQITGSTGYTNSSLNVRLATISTVHLDSPSTTSAVTYKTMFYNDLAAAGVSLQLIGVSTITLMEVSA